MESDSKKLSSRHALTSLVVLWVGIFCFPGPRALFLSLLHPWPQERLVNPFDWETPPLVPEDIDAKVARYEALQRAYPGNRDIELAETCALTGNAALPRLEKLMARYPADLVVLARYLRACNEDFRETRNSGPLINPNWPKRARQITPLTREEIHKYEAMAVQAKRGQRLNPKNGFFDWALMQALFQLNRDDEAVGVLLRTRDKPQFETYEHDLWMVLLRVHSLKGPISPTDCNSLWVDVFFKLSRSRISSVRAERSLPQLIMERVLVLRNAGKVSEAIDLADTLLRVGMRIRSQASTERISSLGTRCIGVSLRDWVPNNVRRWPRKVTTLTTDNLAGYAHAHGRDALARDAIQLDRQLFPARRLPYVNKQNWTGADIRTLACCFALQEYLGCFLRALPLLLASLVISWGFSFQRRNGDVEAYAVPRQAWAVGAAGVVAGLLAAALEFAWFQRRWYFYDDPMFTRLVGLDAIAPHFVPAVLLSSMLYAAIRFTSISLNRGKKSQAMARLRSHVVGKDASFLHHIILGSLPVIINLTIWSGLATAAWQQYWNLPYADSFAEALRLVVWIGPAYCLCELRHWLPLRQFRQAFSHSLWLVRRGILVFLGVNAAGVGALILLLCPAALNYEHTFVAAIQRGQMVVMREKFGSAVN